MDRRLALPLAAALGALLLSSCGQYDSERVASVDGQDISRDELEDFARESSGATDLPTDGAVTRQLLTEMILEPFAATPEQAEQLYNEGLDGSPYICLGAIAVTDADHAAEVEEALAEGTPFADVVSELGADNQEQLVPGGIVSGPDGQECLAYADDLLVPDLTAALSAVEVGQGTEFPTNAGLSVVLLRPWDSLTDETRDTIAAAATDPAALAAADISVNSRFGRWDPESATVVAAV